MAMVLIKNKVELFTTKEIKTRTCKIELNYLLEGKIKMDETLLEMMFKVIKCRIG